MTFARKLPLALALLTLPAAPAAGDNAASGMPQGYVSEVLANGLRVSLLVDSTSPIVATQVWYHVGSANEDQGSRGLAHLFEHMMFGRTARRTEREYADLYHRHGGDNNAYTTFDETVYVSEIAPEHHAAVLEHEADRMVGLLLTPENLENEIRIVTEELRLSTENDPMNRVLVQATRALLGEHPYALWPTGTKEDLAAVTVEACRRFYERYYGPGNAHLVIVGPVDARETMRTVRRLFGAVPGRGSPPVEVPALDGWTFPDEVALREDLPPVELAIAGFPLPPPTAKDYPAVELLGQLLTGGAVNPFRDQLVVRRGKAVEAGSQLLLARRGGALAFYSAHVPYRRKRTAFRLMDETLNHLSRLEWLTEESLEGAKRSLKRIELNRAYYSAARAASIGKARWWVEDEARAFDRAERIDAVTLEDLKRAYRRYIGDRRPVRLYLKPEHVPLFVRMFGWLYPLFD